MIFPFKAIHSLFWSLSRDFSIYGTSFFFWQAETKSTGNLFFSKKIVLKTTQQSNSICNPPSVFQLLRNIFFKKTDFFVLQKHTNYTSWAKSQDHEAKMCFLASCRFHILLLENIEELLQKLAHFVPHINKWTVSIYCSSVDSVEILLSRVVKWLIMCREQSILI